MTLKQRKTKISIWLGVVFALAITGTLVYGGYHFKLEGISPYLTMAAVPVICLLCACLVWLAVHYISKAIIGKGFAFQDKYHILELGGIIVLLGLFFVGAILFRTSTLGFPSQMKDKADLMTTMYIGAENGFAALFGRAPSAVSLFQDAMLLLGCTCFYLFVRTIFGRTMAFLSAGAYLAGSFWQKATLPNTKEMFLVLCFWMTMAWMAFFIKTKKAYPVWGILGGICVAILVTAFPTGVFALLPVLYLLYALKKEEYKRLWWLLGGFAAGVAVYCCLVLFAFDASFAEIGSYLAGAYEAAPGFSGIMVLADSGLVWMILAGCMLTGFFGLLSRKNRQMLSPVLLLMLLFLLFRMLGVSSDESVQRWIFYMLCLMTAALGIGTCVYEMQTQQASEAAPEGVPVQQNELPVAKIFAEDAAADTEKEPEEKMPSVVEIKGMEEFLPKKKEARPVMEYRITDVKPGYDIEVADDDDFDH